MSKKPDNASQPDKDTDKQDKQDKKGKKSKKSKGERSAGPSVAAHPRASFQVRRAKGWGGLVGFGLAAYLSYKAGVPTADIGVRAVVAGFAGYMLAWACAVTVWRHLVLAELRAAVEHAEASDRDDVPAPTGIANATPAGNAAVPATVATPAS
jgi:hypothetical protein